MTVQYRIRRWDDISRRFGEAGKRAAYEYFLQNRFIPSDSAMEGLLAARAPGSPPAPAVRDGGGTTDMDNMTIHDIMRGDGQVIVLTDPDLNLVFAWGTNGGKSTFTVYQEGGNSTFTTMDSWNTDIAPKSLEEARVRCRSRLELIRQEVAAADAEPAVP